jgi:hypothetical protein
MSRHFTDQQMDLRHLHEDSSILNDQQQELIRKYSMKGSVGSSMVQREKVRYFLLLK